MKSFWTASVIRVRRSATECYRAGRFNEVLRRVSAP
jgi:hypothetical protein